MHRFLLEDRVPGFSSETTSPKAQFAFCTHGVSRIEGVVAMANTRKKSAGGPQNSYRRRGNLPLDSESDWSIGCYPCLRTKGPKYNCEYVVHVKH